MIDVAFTRADLRTADVAVVVDVLRATSTATQAIATGYRMVLCTETIDRARQLRGAGRVLAGERNCVRPPGFDQGNSPLEAIERRGDELVLATTNGAPTIVAAAHHAPRVLLACMWNVGSVIRALGPPPGAGRELDVQIVCSGTDGAVALEDVYVAGRLSAALWGDRTDAALVAEGVARAFESPFEALVRSADAAILTEAGLTRDIAYCAREAELDVVPAVIAAGADVAAVADLGRRANGDADDVALDADDTVSV